MVLTTILSDNLFGEKGLLEVESNGVLVGIWWVLHVSILVAIIYLFFSTRKIVKELKNDLKTIILVTWMLGGFILLR